MEHICENYPEANGKSDIVAYFFRRAFKLLRHSGCLGLIATNTIAQGDTRSTGLSFICSHGGFVYDAKKRYKWPGLAAVMVSVVHIRKDQIFFHVILTTKTQTVLPHFSFMLEAIEIRTN